jgi:hypothetical protein
MNNEHTTLGTIKTDGNTFAESTVKMSAKNFRTLVMMIPRTTESNAVCNDIKRIKDELTTVSFESNKTRTRLIEILTDEINYQSFMADIIKFEQTPDIKIVGKIELP